jgi:hypothetical protein
MRPQIFFRFLKPCSSGRIGYRVLFSYCLSTAVKCPITYGHLSSISWFSCAAVGQAPSSQHGGPPLLQVGWVRSRPEKLTTPSDKSPHIKACGKLRRCLIPSYVMSEVSSLLAMIQIAETMSNSSASVAIMTLLGLPNGLTITRAERALCASMGAGFIAGLAGF